MSYLDDIQTALESIAQNTALFDETYFIERTDALDLIEFRIIEALDICFADDAQSAHLTTLRSRALALRDELQQINDRLFQRMRTDISTGRSTPSRLMSELCSFADKVEQDERDFSLQYDSLDILVSGLLDLTPPSEGAEVAMEPDMVPYQPTPARVILEIINKSGISAHDVFCDIGSGLGHVPILVALLTGACTIGIEFQPDYCAVARECAERLHLSNVHFICQDARVADFSNGTIFYMYTPFRGGILQDVLVKLSREAQRRDIRICTYGPDLAASLRQQSFTACDGNTGEDSPITVFKRG